MNFAGLRFIIRSATEVKGCYPTAVPTVQRGLNRDIQRDIFLGG